MGINLALNVNKMKWKNTDISENLIVKTLANQFDATTQIQVQYQSFVGRKISYIQPSLSQCDILSQ